MSTATLPTPAPPPAPELGFTRSRSLSNTSARILNRAIIIFCYASALMTIAALFLIFGYIIYQGARSLNLAIFTEFPTQGLRSCIEGTLVLILMASCIGVPIGMLCGVYLAEYARDTVFSHAIRLVVDVLAGVPSIIVGVLGYELVVVPMHTFSAWAGTLALGFMMTPIIAKTTEEMLKLVPKALREASIGLGGSKTQTLTRIVIPAASGGIITGIMLAVARVAGETAPLLFTVLGSDQPIFSFNATFPFVHVDLSSPFPSLTAQIYKYATAAESDWNRQAWAGMLILITLVLILNILVRFFSSRRKYRAA